MSIMTCRVCSGESLVTVLAEPELCVCINCLTAQLRETSPIGAGLHQCADPQAWLQLLSTLPDGETYTITVPYLVHIMENKLYEEIRPDTIFYFTLCSLAWMLNRASFQVINAEVLDGKLIVTICNLCCQPSGWTKPEIDNGIVEVFELLDAEKPYLLPTAFKAFAKNAPKVVVQ